MDYTDFEKLIAQATAYLRARNAEANRLFGIEDYARYEYDLYRNEMWWSEPHDPKVRARVTIVGSFSGTSNTWLWAWANPHFNDLKTGAIDTVREFGEAEGISKLVEAKWEAELVDGWEMTSVSARLLEAQGAYLSPNEEGGGLFLLYDDLQFIPEEEKEPYRPLKRGEKGSDGDPSPRNS